MDRSFGVESSQSILKALGELHKVVKSIEHLKFQERDEYERSLGIIIGQIQVRLLEPIIAHFPDLDDLAELR